MNKVQCFYRSYLWSVECYGLRDIHDVYKAPSQLKKSAWRIKCDKLQAMGAAGITVVTSSCQSFSMGCIIPSEDGGLTLMYDTGHNVYQAPLTPQDVVELGRRAPCVLHELRRTA